MVGVNATIDAQSMQIKQEIKKTLNFTELKWSRDGSLANQLSQSLLQICL
jgi:hypothetical protein